MSKIKFSETQQFNDIKTAIVDTCKYVACMNCEDLSSNDFVEEQIDAAFYALDVVFKDTCLGDTDSRRAAKMAIYEVIHNASEITPLGPKFKFIEENIDCSMVLNDVLHMMTDDSDEYEYEGGNAMYAIFDELEMA